MIYEFRNGKIITKAAEYSVSYHCNLQCSSCSHMAPFQKKHFPSLESFTSDIDTLSKVLHATDIRLVGGEPLLNPEINDFVKAAKKSEIADTVMVTTNGILLHKMTDEFWEHVDFVSITLYPNAKPKDRYIQMIKNLAKESNTRLRFFAPSLFRTTMVTEPHPMDWITNMIFKTCKNAHLYHCHMIHEGKLYKCAVPPFLPMYLSRMSVLHYDPAQDAFDIHDNKHLFRSLQNFLLSSETMKACSYCLGYVGKFQVQHQLKPDCISNPRLQNITRTKHLDRYKLVKELARFYHRRTVEKLTGNPVW